MVDFGGAIAAAAAASKDDNEDDAEEDAAAEDARAARRELQVHVALAAVLDFEAKHGRRPALGDAADATACVALARRFVGACACLNAR